MYAVSGKAESFEQGFVATEQLEGAFKSEIRHLEKSGSSTKARFQTMLYNILYDLPVPVSGTERLRLGICS